MTSLLRRAAPVLGIALLALPARLDAQQPDTRHSYLCQVSQPMVSRDDRRIEIHDVTYAFKLNSLVPGIEVEYTVRPGPVVVTADYDRDTISATEITNLNAANLMGMKLRIENRPPGTWSSEPDSAGPDGKLRHRFYLDELRADLDLTGFARQRQHPEEASANHAELARFDALVAATVECILQNARRSRPRIHKLRLTVLGWDRYRHYGHLYDVQAPLERKDYRY